MKSSVFVAYLPGGRICGVKPNLVQGALCKNVGTHAHAHVMDMCMCMSLNYSHTNAHMAGSICATRPNRSSGRRRPPRWRRCRSATHRPALRSIDQRSKSASDPRTLLAPPPIPAAPPALPLLSHVPRSDAAVVGRLAGLPLVFRPPSRGGVFGHLILL